MNKSTNKRSNAGIRARLLAKVPAASRPLLAISSTCYPDGVKVIYGGAQ